MSRALAVPTSNPVDAFLKHRTRSRGGFLRGWKDERPPQIDVWMHTQVIPFAVWSHWFPKVVVKDKDDESTVKVFPSQYVCREDEKILIEQYKRKSDGSRAYPPISCPFCRLIETVNGMISEGQLDWLTPIFKFEGDEDTVIRHAGGICNLFDERKNDLDPTQVRALRKAGIKGDEAFKESLFPGCQYVFAVVDNAHPESGVQIAQEPQSLGDKVKDVINDAIESIDDAEKGDPFKTPYVIRWIHNPDKSVEISKKYKARRMEKFQLSPEIEALITSDPPDLSSVRTPPPLKLVRSLFEKHALVELPWDWIFDVEVDSEKEAEEQNFPPKETKETKRSAPKAPPKEQPPADDEDIPCPKCEDQSKCPHIACDTCASPILPTDAKCWGCGHVYKQAAPAEEPKGRKKPKETGARVGY